jgi:hypothetical protein
MRWFGALACLVGGGIWAHGCNCPGPTGTDGGTDAGTKDSGPVDPCAPLGSAANVRTVAQIRGAFQTNPSSILGSIVEVDCAVAAMVRPFSNDAGITSYNIWIQDQAGGPKSGIEVFVRPNGNPPDQVDSTIQEGSRVKFLGTFTQVVGLTSSPTINGRLELAGSATNGPAKLVVVGTATVPPAMQRQDTDLQPTGTASADYVGQKIRVAGPVSAVDGMPGILTYPPKTDGGSPRYYGFALSNGTMVDDFYTFGIKDATGARVCDLGYQLRASAADAGTATPVQMNSGAVGIWESFNAADPDAGVVNTLYPFRCEQFNGAE